MLERYFVKPQTIDRIRASWIAESIEGYVCWMAEHGYAARNVFRRVPVLVQFGAFAAGCGATQVDELPAHVDAFVAEWLRTHGGQPRPPTRRKVACFARSAVEQMQQQVVDVVRRLFNLREKDKEAGAQEKKSEVGTRQ